MPVLSVSIVTYHPGIELFGRLLGSLGDSLERARSAGVLRDWRLYVIENSVSTSASERVETLTRNFGARYEERVEFVRPGTNIGFGRGHNMALERARSDYHLVLNPDVVLEPDAITEAVRYLEEHRETGMLTPAARDEEGSWHSLTKRYPSVLDLLLRGFAPAFLRRCFAARLANYEMRELGESDVQTDIPIASGCFMFCRTPLLNRLHGFSRRFFLYFEDFDLSIRMRSVSRIDYVPAVRIVHYGGRAARKGLRHIGMFMRSAVTFFNLHGWRLR